jgi:tripartite-type tricarboxylate transporter receptor subunit TctC
MDQGKRMRHEGAMTETYRIPRRHMLAGATATLASPTLLPGLARAQGAPIRLVVPYPPGGSSDLIARAVASAMPAQLGGQAVVVENRSGASGNIGLEQVARAAPDGLTIALAPASNLVTNQFLFKLSFDPLTALSPVVLLAASHNVLVVNPNVPARDIQSFVAWARGRDDLRYASSATGSAAHLGMEAFARAAGFRAEHVPYRGIPQALTDVVRGDVQMMLAHDGAARPLLADGRIFALGVASPHRSPGSADVPTIAEQGFPGFQAMSWFGLVAPAGTPAPAIARLNAAANAALKDSAVLTALANTGAEALGGTSEAFRAFAAAEVTRWGDLIKAAGIQLPG